MKIPLQITFHNTKPSDAVEAKIKEHVEKLDRFYEHIMNCHVVVDLPHKHKHKGNIYHVKIDITVPQGVIIINKDVELDHAHEDIYVAIRDTFDAARRRLEDYARKQRGDVKTHQTY